MKNADAAWVISAQRGPFKLYELWEVLLFNIVY